MTFDEFIEAVRDPLQHPLLHALAIIAVSVVGAFVIEWIVRRTLVALASRTETDVDDKIVAALRRPIIFTVLLVGASYANDVSKLQQSLSENVDDLIYTLGVWIWSIAVIEVGSIFIDVASHRASDGSLVQYRTAPIFDFFLKVTVIAVAGYLLLLAWEIDVTAWLASAGIAGVAVGFAARDSLANLFAGIFILADGPYKLGDFIILEDGMRGVVTKIGIRSTRLLTKDDVEVIIPNSVMGANKIVNQTGGPNPRCRVTVDVSVAYGSDVERVTEVLLSCADGVKHLASHPRPVVRFVAFGASGLEFKLHCWIIRPTFVEEATSDLNYRVDGAFAEAGIEIPYTKQDVYIKEMPGD